MVLVAACKGGDEFVMFAYSLSGKQDAVNMAEKIIKKIPNPPSGRHKLNPAVRPV